ncbi:DUF3164 family protein [Ancylobacter defluvii]|uniref:Sulfate transporter n=1 Tax=Ancylobacter defluvii TaxID=1282440 RepID=A0A9W6JYR7_9HYPH|nr:DUF3164 family protein [Ancylobacter defluvii]MBS7586436.1 DUF3164 family protein [Ancylobacter defluvii]GLK85717.1 sulfate transporter [Ancylobacter defluvii]
MADDVTAAAAAIAVPPGLIEVNGKFYLEDHKGVLVPVENVKAEDRLEDEIVRKIFSYAEPLSDEIARFKAHTFDDVRSLQSLLAQEYGASPGGEKGNVTLTSFDGLLKVQVAIAELIEFGAQLQTAKVLVDDCLREWSADSRAEIRAIITRAFSVDQAGKVKRADLLSLQRLDIDDPRWKEAMRAVKDSMKPVGTKEYVRFYRRATREGRWEAVTIDLAAA